MPKACTQCCLQLLSLVLCLPMCSDLILLSGKDKSVPSVVEFIPPRLCELPVPLNHDDKSPPMIYRYVLC